MAHRLRDRKLKPDRIITSPAVRALATANIFAKELHLAAARLVQDERLYLASPKALLQVVQEIGDLVVGRFVVRAAVDATQRQPVDARREPAEATPTGQRVRR